MPLIKCPDCASEVSDAAPNCPKCARPLKAKKKRTGEAVLSVLFGLGLCGLWFGAHMYLIFPLDTAIMGAILMISGAVLFSKQ